MSNELSFAAWMNQVKNALVQSGITTEPDEDMLYMCYDMEQKSVEEAVLEIKQAIADGNN
jgi:hypothetical protein